MGGRGEGWVYSVDSAVLDYGMGRRLGKLRNLPIEMTVKKNDLIFDYSTCVQLRYTHISK